MYQTIIVLDTYVIYICIMMLYYVCEFDNNIEVLNQH